MKHMLLCTHMINSILPSPPHTRTFDLALLSGKIAFTLQYKTGLRCMDNHSAIFLYAALLTECQLFKERTCFF